MVGTANIANAVERSASHDCRCVAWSKMQDTAKTIHRTRLLACQHLRKICTQCCDTEVPPLITCTRRPRCIRNAWASDEASQLTSDHHSRAQMIVSIPEFGHIATANMHVACVASVLLLTETPASITPHVCETGRSQRSNRCPHNEDANFQSIPPSQSTRLQSPSACSNKQVVAAFHDKTSESIQQLQRLRNTC